MKTSSQDQSTVALLKKIWPDIENGILEYDDEGNLICLTYACAGQKVDRLPAEIGQLINLEHLSFHDNPLMGLPDEINQLPQLRDLYLDESQFHLTKFLEKDWHMTDVSYHDSFTLYRFSKHSENIQGP